MKKPIYVLAGILGFSLMSAAQAENFQTIGWIEHVKLGTSDLMMRAKIDTGADNSSIHADNMTVYEKDGVKMVKFTVENKQGNAAKFDLPVVRIANIKRKGAEPLHRPVVKMNLCLGHSMKTVYVNLANRGNFKYRMLVGRSYLKNQYLVNTATQYTEEPSCGNEKVAELDS
jgi:hypothetical protein